MCASEGKYFFPARLIILLTLLELFEIATPSKAIGRRVNPFQPELLVYRNRSIDSLCKSMDWFLHNSNAGLK